MRPSFPRTQTTVDDLTFLLEYTTIQICKDQKVDKGKKKPEVTM
jgi:hypothetical protein